ncbi:uncharacterized protein LOC144637930 [Oculina patagonica]
MGVKRVMNLSHLVIFLILSELPSLCSSPIPMLEDFLHHKSSALPSDEKGQLSQQDPNGLLGKQVNPGEGSKSGEARTLGRLTAQNRLKPAESQPNKGSPVASRGEKLLMQMRVPRPSVQGDPNLNDPASKAEAGSGLPLGSGNKRSGRQPWEFLPIKPEEDKDDNNENIPLQLKVDFDGREQAKNSVVKPQAKPIVYGQDLPLGGGSSIMNLGRLNLKTDWCNAHPFEETIHHHGCNSVKVHNNMCYGQCNSFYIPKRFFSCSYCAPSRQETINVRLECPGQNPSFVIKKVKLVLECACKDCGLPQS